MPRPHTQEDSGPNMTIGPLEFHSFFFFHPLDLNITRNPFFTGTVFTVPLFEFLFKESIAPPQMCIRDRAKEDKRNPVINTGDQILELGAQQITD